METDLQNIANSYFDSWKTQDFKTVASLLSENIIFIGALAEAHGIEECLNGMRGLANIMTDIVILHMWSDKSDIITWYELHTNKTTKPLSVVNWMHIENNKITKIRVIFDPRPMLG